MDSDKQFFYANSLELAISPYDFTFKFLRQGAPDGVLQQGQPLPPKRIDELSVAMSPAHAKAMIAAQFKAIIAYEKQFGKIAFETEKQNEFDNVFGAILKK